MSIVLSWFGFISVCLFLRFSWWGGFGVVLVCFGVSCDLVVLLAGLCGLV